MTINNDATLVVGAGNFFTAPFVSASPAALPTNLLSVTTPWVNVGHTSLEDIFSITSDGGDATTIGTLQNKALRTSYAARTESFQFTLQQFDADALKLYYGSNAKLGANGELQVPVNPTPTIASFLAVFVDGDNTFAFYAAKAEIFRADDLSLSDTESLAGLPISVKPLVIGGAESAYSITPLGAAA